MSSHLRVRNGTFGRGIFANDEISKGETIITPKPEGIITVDMAIKSLNEDLEGSETALNCLETMVLYIAIASTYLEKFISVTKKKSKDHFANFSLSNRSVRKKGHFK